MIWLIGSAPDSTGFYFYSSLIQVKAAIFSIYGLFFVFKMQICNQIIETSKGFISAANGNTIPAITNFDKMSIEEKAIFINKKKESNLYNSEVHHYQNWLNNEKSVIKIKRSFSKPLFILVVGMIIDAIALLFQQFINKILLIELFIYGVAISLFIWSLILVYKSIKNIVLSN